MKKIRVGSVLVLAFLVLVSFSACSKATENEQQLAKVTRGDLVVSVSADGNLSLPGDRKLTFGITGTVAKINVEEGDKVTKGQVLASLDTTSLELVVRTAEVDLETATNSYRKLTYPYDFRTWTLDVPVSMAFIGSAQQKLDEALKITQELGLSREQYSWEQYWDIFNRLKQAQDDLVKAREQLIRGYGQDVFASGMLRMTDIWTLKAAELGMEKAQLTLDEAKSNLEKAVMTAPFDGVVATIDIKEGDSLSAFDYATRTIVELVDLSNMEFNAEVDEIDIPGVRLGQSAIISVDALPDAKFEGKVTYTSPVSTEKSGLILYKAKIDFDVPDGSGLRAGMRATADIIINKRSNVLLVPSRAIRQDSSGKPVVKVMVGEQIEERPVVSGISDGNQTEIVAGLNEGEVVVIEKQAKPQPSGGGLFGQ